MSENTNTEVLPEGYDQERWDDLKGALRTVPNEDAIVAVLTLAMLGYEVEGSDMHPTPQDALIAAARINPSEVVLASFFAVAQGLDLL